MLRRGTPVGRTLLRFSREAHAPELIPIYRPASGFEPLPIEECRPSAECSLLNGIFWGQTVGGAKTQRPESTRERRRAWEFDPKQTRQRITKGEDVPSAIVEPRRVLYGWDCCRKNYKPNGMCLGPSHHGALRRRRSRDVSGLINEGRRVGDSTLRWHEGFWIALRA
jgi:hypothetical protein